MPSFSIQKVITLPEQTVEIYDTDKTTVIDSFTVVFFDLSRKEIDDLLERVTDKDDDYTPMDALDVVVASYPTGWDGVPNKLSEITDKETKELVAEKLKDFDLSVTQNEQQLTPRQQALAIHTTMRGWAADAAWTSFHETTATQFLAYQHQQQSGNTSSKSRKSKKRR